MRDADILTVDRYTFVGDERFESHYEAPIETWNLVIKYVQERDAGIYECQVSTEPKMSQFFSLRVVIPKVSILPLGDRYVKSGSRVRVDCQITDVVQFPDYIFWYYEDKRVMDHLDSNLMVTVKKAVPETITSTLTIHKVPPESSGNYTCMPSNLHAASVIIHVLNEKHPEAMQGERDNGATGVETHPSLVMLMLHLWLIWCLFYSHFPESCKITPVLEKRLNNKIPSSARRSANIFTTFLSTCLYIFNLKTNLRFLEVKDSGKQIQNIYHL